MPDSFLMKFISSDALLDLRWTRIQVRADILAPDSDSPAPTVFPLDTDGRALIPEGLNVGLVITNPQIETLQGEVLQQIEWEPVTLVELDPQSPRNITVNDEVVQWCQHRPAPNTIWTRAGKFSVLGSKEFSFEGFQLYAHAVNQEELQRLEARFNIEQSAEDNWFRSLDHAADILSAFRLDLASIGFDGSFEVELSREGGPVGWMWVLSGEHIAVGFRRDSPKVERAFRQAIFLPKSFQDDGGPDTGTNKRKAEKDGYGSSRPLSPTTPPLNASEEQIIEHSELFSDDPGPFCKPFKNPERILGERRFSTILRVSQPEIAAAAGIKADQFRQSLEVSLEDFVSGGNESLSPIEAGDTDSALLENLITNARSDRQSITEIFNSPLAREQRRRGRKVPSGINLIDWEGDTSEHQAVSVARGHILEWRVRWRSNGYSLGDVAHTLTLAPRQIKRIMKVDWERRETARRTEAISVDDSVTQGTDSSRDYQNAVASTLNEWSKGSSKSSTTGAAAGAGFAMPGFVVGGGVTHGSAKSQASSSGERNVSASEEQKLRDAIRQYGESRRKFEATVITELAQEETSEAVSETIANPNYCHSLTVVYYNILRHLRVDTELGGVSECLFVPFAITPFTATFKIEGRRTVKVPLLDRIVRYKSVFRRYLKEKELKWVLRYLEDMGRQFKDISGKETIPAGPRTSQTVTSLRGEIRIRLDIRSPLSGDEDETALEKLADEAADKGRKLAAKVKEIAKRFTPLSPVLGTAVSSVAGVLAEKPPEEREIDFQREIAPDIARNFLDKLKLNAGTTELPADFTLRGSYRQGKVHRVSFSIARSSMVTAGLTRDQITELTLSSEVSLPIYSVANVKGGQIRFSTEFYERNASTSEMNDDLLVTPDVIVTGDSDLTTRYAENDTALLEFPPTSWEERSLRDDIRRDVAKLAEHVDSHLHYYHKAIWWSMDRDELYTLLDGFVISETNSRSIASVVERNPIAIMGNTLVFRVARGASINDDEDQSLERVFELYKGDARKSDPMRVSLPTDGLYAQALMDECGACEEHYGSTDWVLERDDIMPQDLDRGLLSSRRTEPQNLLPTTLPESLINIQNAPATPNPSGLQGVLNAATSSDAFRDMAGLANTQANAQAAMQAAKRLATQFGGIAAKSLDANRAAVERVRSSNLPADDQEKLIQETPKQPMSQGTDTTSAQAREAKEVNQQGFNYHSKTKTPDGYETETKTEYAYEGAPSQGGFQLASMTKPSLGEPIRADELIETTVEAWQRKIQGWRNAVADIANEQIRFWTRDPDGANPVRLDETEARSHGPNRRPPRAEINEYYERLMDYRMAAGEDENTAYINVWRNIGPDDEEPWSGAFVCYVMKQLGVKQEDGFYYNSSHSRYWTEAVINRLNLNYGRPFWLFRLNEVGVSVGDIVVKNRSRTPDAYDFDDLLSTEEGVTRIQLQNGVWSWNQLWATTHADIVMSIDTIDGNQYATTVGGNTSDLTGTEHTVAQKRYFLNENNRVQHEVDSEGNRDDSGTPFAVIKIIDDRFSEWMNSEIQHLYSGSRLLRDTFLDVFPNGLEMTRAKGSQDLIFPQGVSEVARVITAKPTVINDAHIEEFWKDEQAPKPI